MSRWDRLKLVLRVAYWAFAAFVLVMMIRADNGEDPARQTFVGVGLLFGVPYLFVAAVV